MLIATKLVRRLLLGLAIAVGVLWLMFFVLRATGLLHTYVVPTSSMSPTLKCGDHMAVVRYWLGSPERNDVVAFRAGFDPAAFNPGAVFVKRVAAIGGDRIEARDGHLLVNGRVIGAYSMSPFGPHTVARGSYFMLGDQREISDDSRSVGDVPGSAIIGRAVLVYWPLGRLRRLAGHAPSRQGSATC